MILQYDALNRLKQLTLPENVAEDRKVITPSYNRAGALEKVNYDGTDYVRHIAYNAKGQRLMIAFGNNMMTRYVYHVENFRLLRQKTERYSQSGWTFTPQTGTVKQDTSYEYDLNGNILKQKERAPGSDMGSFDIDRNFAYDPLNRLLQATGRESATNNGTEHYGEITQNSYNSGAVQAYTRNYTYDKVGNIQTLTQTGSNGFTRNFNYVGGSNRLDYIDNGTITLESYTYDANGNQSGTNTNRKYFWDYADRMVAYCNQSGTAEPTVYAHYLYDAAGQRVKKLIRTQGGDIETRVYIDGIFEYGRSDTDEQNLVHIMDASASSAQGSRIARVRIGHDFGDTSSATLYNIEDHLGSSTLRLSTTGTVVDREEYYPFGDSSLRTFDKKRYRYTGKEKDAESGLYYYGARYYAAWTCRFVSVDPLAADYPFYTPYNYAGNKPIGKVDIDGMQEQGAQTAPTDTSSTDTGTGDNPTQQKGVNNTTQKVENVEKKPELTYGKYIDPSLSDEDRAQINTYIEEVAAQDPEFINYIEETFGTKTEYEQNTDINSGTKETTGSPSEKVVKKSYLYITKGKLDTSSSGSGRNFVKTHNYATSQVSGKQLTDDKTGEIKELHLLVTMKIDIDKIDENRKESAFVRNWISTSGAQTVKHELGHNIFDITYGYSVSLDKLNVTMNPLESESENFARSAQKSYIDNENFDIKAKLLEHKP